MKPFLFSSYLGLNLVQAVAAFGMVAIFTRLLPPEAYGRYVLALASLNLVMAVTHGWLHSAMGRFYAKARQEGTLARYGSTGLAALLLASGLTIVLWLLGHAGMHQAGQDASWEALLWAAGAALVLRAIFQTHLEIHRAAGRSTRYVLLEGAHLLVSLALSVGLLLATPLRESAPLWGLALASGILVVYDGSVWHRLGAHPTQADRQEWLSYWRFGWPISLSLLLSQLLANGDRYLVSWLLDNASVGLYAVAYALVDRPMGILFNSLAMATLPRAFAAMEQQGPEAATAILAHNWENQWAVTLPAAAGLSLLARPLVTLLAGHDFAAAAQVIPWVAAGTLAQGFMLHHAAHLFLLHNRTAPLVWTNLAPLAVNVGLNLWLIPTMGLTGAAIATCFSYLLGLLVRILLADQLFTTPLPRPWKPVFKAICATAGMCVVLLGIPDWPGAPGLAGTILLGVFSYALFGWLVNLAGCRHWSLSSK
ncbi:MAG: lipopolysaccharide biosynthesis protein [Magnetococcales bacterium]|nr:lipopolysaccharide biosynthesis protein [Magnetococcales bacterium]